MSAAQAGVYERRLGISSDWGWSDLKWSYKTVVRGCQSMWSTGREGSEKGSTAHQIIFLK